MLPWNGSRTTTATSTRHPLSAPFLLDARSNERPEGTSFDTYPLAVFSSQTYLQVRDPPTPQIFKIGPNPR
jgi:hypothetical protein